MQSVWLTLDQDRFLDVIPRSHKIKMVIGKERVLSFALSGTDLKRALWWCILKINFIQPLPCKVGDGAHLHAHC